MRTLAAYLQITMHNALIVTVVDSVKYLQHACTATQTISTANCSHTADRLFHAENKHQVAREIGLQLGE